MRLESGFSLIELVVVLAVMGVLATVALPLAELNAKREREAQLRFALREIRNAIDAYKRAVDEGRIELSVGATGYPPNLEVLARGVPDRRSVAGAKIYFLRALPADPMTDEEQPSAGAEHADAIGIAARSWAPRSYASSPDDPRPGQDVYDVHSRSGEAGLDGRRYSQW